MPRRRSTRSSAQAGVPGCAVHHFPAQVGSGEPQVLSQLVHLVHAHPVKEQVCRLVVANDDHQGTELFQGKGMAGQEFLQDTVPAGAFFGSQGHPFRQRQAAFFRLTKNFCQYQQLNGTGRQNGTASPNREAVPQFFVVEAKGNLTAAVLAQGFQRSLPLGLLVQVSFLLRTSFLKHNRRTDRQSSRWRPPKCP